jgi:nucleotide-binding universal stress UspA family protein
MTATLPIEQGTVASPARPRGLIRTILLATDLSPAATSAALYAIELASQLSSRLVAISVVEPVVTGTARLGRRVDQVRSERELSLRDIAQRAHDAVARAEFLVWEGVAGPTVVSATHAERADLVVIGTRGHEGVARMLLGSVSDYVVRHAPCPVVVVRAGT